MVKITLLPVLRPSFNAREICKQSVLLENHLNEPQQRCKDCINKHFLTIEALAEEAISLHCPQTKRLCPRALHSIPATIRRLQSELVASKYNPQKCRASAAALRKIRKSLMPDFAAIPMSQLPYEPRVTRTTPATVRTRRPSRPSRPSRRPRPRGSS